jgi:hypothetical protein
MELVLFYLAVGFWRFAPGWARALLYASPLLVGAALLARARKGGKGPGTAPKC